MIKSQGREYDVYNADGGGGRSVPDYGDEPDGTLVGVLEQRSRSPSAASDSDGTDVETDLEIRSVVDDLEIRPMGSANGYPTKLEHPNGTVYDVVRAHEEDGGVTVIAVVEG